MTEDDRVQYKFMIPTELKRRLEHLAVDKRRSLSAEIIERLEASLDDAQKTEISQAYLAETVAKTTINTFMDEFMRIFENGSPRVLPERRRKDMEPKD